MRIAVAGGTGLVGRHVVEAARRGGHEVVVLSRSHGVDLRSGQALESAVDGVDAIIDVTNPGAGERDRALDFFVDVTGRLQAVGGAQHVRHIVTLSIVGIERAPENTYYTAKLRQEQAALAGPVPATILRATQFHEFAVQMLRRTSRDGAAHVRSMRVQPVAARTVANVLMELAGGPALGKAPDLGGPEQADLVALARQFVARYALQLSVIAAAADPTVPYGATLPAPGARLEGPTFAAWLETDDAAQLAT
jgi:uncharacterized protein YbjT (DUF2867 family)